LELYFSPHAREVMTERNIPERVVREVFENPQQVLECKEQERHVYQSKYLVGKKLYLIRVIVADDCPPATVVTVYKTTNIDRYWNTGV
jgi:hypothetical protein